MPNHALNVNFIRQQFPALQEPDAQGHPYVFFDGPGGTQVPLQVIQAMQDYLIRANANSHGQFITSHRTDQTLIAARQAMADFLNTPSSEEIIFGPNMTSLTFNLSRAMGRRFQPGDEIIVTRLDHEANISPWLALEEQGVVIKWTDFEVADCRLNVEHLAALLSKKTKLVAVGYASNAVGTINPIQTIARMAHQVGAWLWVDAVHYAPHGPIDVQQLECDFLVCSAYKFFGPHVGVLWGRWELLDQLSAYKVLPAGSHPPDKFETGTLNHEGIAGVTATINYLAQLGRDLPPPAADLTAYSDRARDLKQAMYHIAQYERSLFKYLMTGLQELPGITIYGITNPAEFGQRCPTLAFTKEGFSPAQVAQYLGERGVFVWHGHYYAVRVMARLGLNETGGAVRVGLVHYNTQAEVDRLLAALETMS